MSSLSSVLNSRFHCIFVGILSNCARRVPSVYILILHFLLQFFNSNGLLEPHQSHRSMLCCGECTCHVSSHRVQQELLYSSKKTFINLICFTVK